MILIRAKIQINFSYQFICKKYLLKYFRFQIKIPFMQMFPSDKRDFLYEKLSTLVKLLL